MTQDAAERVNSSFKCARYEPDYPGLQGKGLFEAVPGLDYDETFDRASSTPAIRGVQSSTTSVLRQKVTTFIDGLPILGSQGTLQLTGVERVEVFRLKFPPILPGDSGLST